MDLDSELTIVGNSIHRLLHCRVTKRMEAQRSERKLGTDDSEFNKYMRIGQFDYEFPPSIDHCSAFLSLGRQTGLPPCIRTQSRGRGPGFRGL